MGEATNTVGSLTMIGRYPAKSMLGESLTSTELTDQGVLGDRGWAVRDEVRGGIRGAKKIGALMHLGARYLTEPTAAAPTPTIEITMPDGSVAASTDADVNDRISAALDHAVTLWPLQPASDLEHYRRGAADSDDLLVELRDIFGRTEDEPLPDLSIFPPDIIEYESVPGTYVDAWPLLLMTQQSVDQLQALLPDVAIDLRRFRPNLVIDLADSRESESTDRWPEQAWIGRRFALGTAEIEIVCTCPRCVMITRSVAELPEDRSIMRTVVREADQNLGVYATVTKPGVVAVGDSLVALD